MSLNLIRRSWLLLPAAALLQTGCGGLNTTQSVSPATFFMPGFMQIQPEKKTPDLLDTSGTALAAQLAQPQTRIP